MCVCLAMFAHKPDNPDNPGNPGNPDSPDSLELLYIYIYIYVSRSTRRPNTHHGYILPREHSHPNKQSPLVVTLIILKIYF